MKDLSKTLALLESEHSWPCSYLFKFILPRQKREQFLSLMEWKGEYQVRPSKKGNYISVSFKRKCGCPEEVIAFYQKASCVEGVIAL